MLTAILGGLSSIALIAGAVVFVIKWAQYQFGSTPEETKERIDQQVDAEEEKVKQTGRPQP